MTSTLLKRLTARQSQVLALLAKGYSMKAIGEYLNISYRTVTFHKYRAMEKIGVGTNTDLLYFAFKSNRRRPKSPQTETKRKSRPK